MLHRIRDLKMTDLTDMQRIDFIKRCLINEEEVDKLANEFRVPTNEAIKFMSEYVKNMAIKMWRKN